MEQYTQFDRDYLLTYKNLQTGKVFQMTGLRCEFDIKLYVDNKDKSNEASISITNLGRELSKELGQQYGHIRLDIGYKGNIKTVVQGDTINVQMQKQGTGLVTTFVLAPNFHNTAIKPIAVTFPEGVTLLDVVRKVASQLGLSYVETSKPQAWQRITLPYGYSPYGTGKQVLDELGRTYNIEYSIEHNALSVRDRYAVLEGKETAFLLSKETGMIDIPYMDSEEISKRVGSVLADNEQFVSINQSFKKDGTPRKVAKFRARRYGIRVKALINPSIKANSLIKIVSEDYAEGAYFRVRSVQFKGDSRGGDWTMDIWGDPVEAIEE